MGRAAIDRGNIQIVMLPHTPGISSSQLREREMPAPGEDSD